MISSSLLACLLLLLALLTTTASARSFHGPGAKVHNLWVRHAHNVSHNDTITFHVYWELNTANATSQRCHERGPAGSRAVLQCKMDALGPSPSIVAKTKQWLAAAGDLCEFTWNAVNCRNVPIRIAEAIFKLEAGSVQAYCKATTCNVTGFVQSHKVSATAKAAAHRHFATTAALTIPDDHAIDFVSGMHLSNYNVNMARHAGKTGNPLKKPSLTSRRQTTTSSYVPSPEANFAARAGNAAPLVIHVTGQEILFIPYCQNGATLTYSTTVTYGDAWCSSTDTAPVSAFITMTPVSGGTATTSSTTSITSLQVGKAGQFLTSNLSTQAIYNAAVFLYPMPSFSVSPWARMAFSVTVNYGSGSLTDTASAFYGGVTYGAGSTALDGNTISARPVLSLTTPNSNYNRPADINALYVVPGGATAAGQISGVVEFTSTEAPGAGIASSDIESYLNTVGVQSQVYVVGDSTIVDQFESTLDVELMAGLANGGTSYLLCLSYGPGGNYAQYSDSLSGFASYALSSPSGTFTQGASTVWSISYGGPEWIDSNGAVDAQMTQVNTLFEQLTDAGVTITASSGDTGTYFQVNESVSFGANFPASSPYVVAVGATARSEVGEVACNVKDGNAITTGGGFSTAFAAPSWQTSSLTGNAKRGVPDVSALGAWIYTVIGGGAQPLFGTSASAPIFAAFIVLLNQQRVQANLGTLRQANSFFYNQSANPSGNATAPFFDIVSGDNCAGESGSQLSGNLAIWGTSKCYTSGTGWDAATGLGTPNVSALIIASSGWNPAEFAGSASAVSVALAAFLWMTLFTA